MDRGRLYKTPLGHYYTSQSKILFLHTQFTSTVTHEKLLHLNYSFDCDNLRASNYFRINLVRNLTRVFFFSHLTATQGKKRYFQTVETEESRPSATTTASSTFQTIWLDPRPHSPLALGCLSQNGRKR